eukprot:m.62412 g.62412  ORF g.62412 m.62412 type:complete len:402 (-) comp11910_c0_seq1:303-1508(-)
MSTTRTTRTTTTSQLDTSGHYNPGLDVRMAMQRELDAARAQLRGAERDTDGLRRQAAQCREEAARHRAENMRLNEELRSCRERLNAALDGQQELISKNTHKHEMLVELQAQASKYRGDASACAARNDALETEVKRLSDELDSMTRKATAKEHESEAQLSTAQTDLGVANERSARLQNEVDRMSAAVIDLEDQLHSFRENEKLLHERLASKDALIAELQAEKSQAQLQAETRAQELNTVQSTATASRQDLEAQLAAAKDRERVLSEDLKSLHRYIGRTSGGTASSSFIASRALPNTTFSTSRILPSTSFRTSSYSRPNVSTVLHSTRPTVSPLETSTYRYSTTTYDYDTVPHHTTTTYVDSGSTLASSLRTDRIRRLAEEKEEAERLADIARSRLQRSLIMD